MASLPWLKLWAEMIDDPKMASLSDRDFRVWVELLCLARLVANERGVISMRHDRICWRLRRQEADFEQSLGKLADAGLILWTPEETVIRQWNNRQYGKESNAPSQIRERVRKHRENQADATPAGNADVTRLKRGCNATDKEGDKEKEEETEAEGKGCGENPSVPIETPLAGLPASPSAPAPVVEWPVGLSDVRDALARVNAPPEFNDPAFWQRIDEWLGPTNSGVAYLAEFRKFLVWHDSLSKARKKKNMRQAFRNWLAKAESWSENRAQRQAFRSDDRRR